MLGENYPALVNRRSSQLSVQSIPATAPLSLDTPINKQRCWSVGPSIHLAVIFLGPSDEEEKVVKGLLEGCSLALRGYTQGKAPILSFSWPWKIFYMPIGT